MKKALNQKSSLSKAKSASKNVKVKTSRGSLLLDGQPSKRLKRYLNHRPQPRPSEELDPRLSDRLDLEQLVGTIQQELLAHSVGELLRLARESRGLSLRELAQKLGVKHPRIVQLEQAQTAIELQTLSRHAEVLGYAVRLEFIPREGGEVLVTQLP